MTGIAENTVSGFHGFGAWRGSNEVASTAVECVLRKESEELLRMFPSRLLRQNDLSTSYTLFMPDGSDLVDSNRSKPATVPAVLAPAAAAPHEEFFVTLQRWEGYVLSINGKVFAAKLIDLTSSTHREDAEFSIREVSDDDQSLLRVGASFYWSIGYHTDASGRLRTASEIRFRRLPPLTDEELDRARDEAKALFS